jgi:hypothetical protein
MRQHRRQSSATPQVLRLRRASILVPVSLAVAGGGAALAATALASLPETTPAGTPIVLTQATGTVAASGSASGSGGGQSGSSSLSSSSNPLSGLSSSSGSNPLSGLSSGLSGSSGGSSASGTASSGSSTSTSVGSTPSTAASSGSSTAPVSGVSPVSSSGPSATTVHTGLWFAGSMPYLVAMGSGGLLLLGWPLLRRLAGRVL